ncbi:MAG: hypothetical protein ACD_71C00016G0002 [uncultured bacterium (gcode 4)]|uniref:DUF4276 family protein n=2 Tax=Bacteria TaxID=2 RepID=K1Z5I0_9BACT|nr:MAG: hypothetical protein ACD_71C00016G0002 [uncultured bacterium (gcode 4)]KKS41322.1 MAG: hypothetical protein UV04_C0010G0022 [Candidatus Gottesmanbacteria bacterium GW2011_GWA2_42_16]KKS55913.1 MAG: hypothetical protein UV17_C0005G0022 [Candidatus Gottesmanbacteria bacterium GW2011_GWA1_42_26]KKS87001.1 MAG: hypothetical protein UV61_C0005G0022 [Candidatus Gottesmanbacteria bacterium GW2011_GWB1_43_11]OGG07807.1 MAG: hypothetical protein A2699_04540 [Candidatus Gottesmanbacteria bacteriu
MIIGILAESDNDSEPIKEIVNTILKPHISTIRFITYESGTGIFNDMLKASKLFFNAEPSCDIALYLNDLDNQPERCRKIRKWATTYCSKNPSKIIIVGCPDPTFEQWFINEENSIKKVLNLNSSNPLPYTGLHPKSRLENMIYKNTDITISKKNAYIDIAKNLNMSLLIKKDKSFKRFYDDLMKGFDSFKRSN